MMSLLPLNWTWGAVDISNVLQINETKELSNETVVMRKYK
jgi:hypothetical protein